MNRHLLSRNLLIFICYSTLLFSCHNESKSLHNWTLEEYNWTPKFKDKPGIEFPQFTPCPEGWAEEAFDAGDGYSITYCQPPTQANPLASYGTLLPQFSPCPEGWREVLDETTDIVICDPFPEVGPMDCGMVDSIHFPGEAECSQIGSPCPETDWATNLPNEGNIVYVRAGETSGDGSRDNPFGTISKAIEQRETPTIIALSKGTFHESVELKQGMVLWGACVAETIVMSSSPSEQNHKILLSYQALQM